MKNQFYFLAFALFMLAFSACGGEKSQKQPPASGGTVTASLQKEAPVDMQALLRTLDELAEIERTGSWLQGMALSESGIREKTGDYAGAVAAAYKEMAFAYGRGLIQKNDIELGLLNLLEMKSEESVTAAANAILAFLSEQWTTALSSFEKLFNQYDEPDGFGSWMILVCSLEKDKENRRASAAYKAIRARYAQFPEYWYRGAKVFSGAVSAEYAENCINLSARGPFADECRKIIAAYTGLKTEDGLSIKTKTEIEAIISESINAGNPQLLEPLLPLLNLPDNPYTVYAAGALRALTSAQKFREYFNVKASASSGRLAERLSYICRG